MIPMRRLKFQKPELSPEMEWSLFLSNTICFIGSPRHAIIGEMELRLSEFGILQGLDKDVVFAFFIIADGATGPV